jgi:hypothetical protein
MRKRKSDQPKRRGAPAKPRRNYKLLHLRWEVFKRQNSHLLTDEQRARVFLRKYKQWIEGDLGVVVGSYTRLRNAADGDGRKEHKREGEQRRKTWHVGIVGIKGQRKLLTSPLVDAQQAYLLGISGRNYSLATGG